MFAQDTAAGNSAALLDGTPSAPEATQAAVVKYDYRTDALKQYLRKYDFTLANESKTFIDEADANDIDWKLLASIAGVESTFGQQVPVNCNNAWGFGIYANHTKCFPSYNEAIKTISKAIRKQYIDTWGDNDIYAIGHDYAASPTWAYKVNYFMNGIDEFYLKYVNNHKTLPISL